MTSRSTSKRVCYAAHTRANTCVDREKIARALGLDFEDCDFQIRIDSEADSPEALNGKQQSPLFGLVNPLNIDVLFQFEGHTIDAGSIRQLFDHSLQLDAGFPNTVTTNTGKRTEAFEVNPDDLVAAVSKFFKKTTVCGFSYPDPIWLGREGQFVKEYWLRFPPPTGPKIGILTGNSPESGMTLWNDVLVLYRNLFRSTTDVLMPEVVVHSLPAMGLSMELIRREDSVWRSMKQAIRQLLESGCKLITVACNTTIYYEPKIQALCEPYDARFISIAEACLPAIKKSLRQVGDGEDLVGLVGIGPVIDLDGGYSGYARHLHGNDIRVISCSGTKLAYAVKSIGVDSQKGRGQKKEVKARTKTNVVTEFRNLIREGLPGAKVVVLSLTEVSLAYRQHIEKASSKHVDDRQYIDPIHELARCIVLSYLRAGLRGSPVLQIPVDFDLEEELQARLDRAALGQAVGDDLLDPLEASHGG